MSSFEPDDGIDALLRDSMRSAADSVTPAGDGLSRIQQRVSTRRSRQRWMRPTMALGSAVAVALVTVGAYAAVHNSGKDKVETPPITTQPPTELPPTSVSPTTPPPPATEAFPKRAIFPFTSAKDERAWEQEAAQGHSPWQGDPKTVATAWVANFLQLPTVNHVVTTISTPTKVDVQIGRMQNDASSQREITVTTVHLVKYGHAWIVTGASDDSGLLKISSPKAGALVTSPLVASGPGGGVHRAARVQVRDAGTPTKYGEGNDGSFGSTQGWTASVSFSAPVNPVGVLVVIEYSDADGLPIRVTAEQVRFGSSSVSAGPQYFYGIKGGRVTKFHASDGSAVHYLTDPQPGGPASDPQLVGSDVYFIRATGPCSGALHKVSTTSSDNTPPELDVADPDNGYVITGFAMFAPDGQASPDTYSYFEQACDSSTSPQAKLVSLNGGHRHVVKYPGIPPRIVADPSYEPSGQLQFLDAIVETGHASYLARFDTYNTTSPTPSRNACPGYDTNNGRPWALETDASGMVWFATQTGSSMQVWKCGAGGQSATVAFTIPGNRQPKDVDVSSDGSVLLTDLDGHIWRWDGSGGAHPLSPSEPVTDVTW